jgi:tRNA1(Val) A37 N6-methylase TrmN6
MMARPSKYTSEDLIKIMKSVGKKNLSKKDIDKNPNIECGSMTIIRYFGSWKQALSAAGLEQGVITGRKKIKNSIIKVGWKNLELKEYDDNHIFFSKEEVWKYHLKNSKNIDKTIKEIINPFLIFLRHYDSKYGWIYPKKFSDSEWLLAFHKLKLAEPILYSSSPMCISQIKGHFKSMWDAAVGRNDSPIKIFRENNKTMLRLLKYRFSLSNSRDYSYKFGNQEVKYTELFDVSFKHVRRALEVNKYVIGLFKPLLAKWIYTQYGFDGMNVWDPCAGFAGRMLGFLSAFNNGNYYAHDINTPLVHELNQLSKILNVENRVNIMNAPMESSKICNMDLCFTCPPYHNVENYNNGSKFMKKEEWENTFLKTLMQKCYEALKPDGKCVIVFNKINIEPCKIMAKKANLIFEDLISIKNNKTHLTGKNNYEYIIVFRK